MQGLFTLCVCPVCWSHKQGASLRSAFGLVHARPFSYWACKQGASLRSVIRLFVDHLWEQLIRKKKHGTHRHCHRKQIMEQHHHGHRNPSDVIIIKTCSTSFQNGFTRFQNCSNMNGARQFSSSVHKVFIMCSRCVSFLWKHVKPFWKLLKPFWKRLKPFWKHVKPWLRRFQKGFRKVSEKVSEGFRKVSERWQKGFRKVQT